LLKNSGYDWVTEALEEALDLSIYLSAKLIEVKNAAAAVPVLDMPRTDGNSS
jgi:hypothetical protein